jgi:hypothetical protein
MTDSAEYVAERLGGLGPAWRVVQAVPLGDGHARMDHLVIGPGGVFAVHTELREPARAGAAAERVARQLAGALGQPVEVTPLVVQVFRDPVADPPTEVVVCHMRDLAGFLKNRTPVLGATTVSAIHAAARRPATWRARPEIAQPVSAQHEITTSWPPTKQARIFPQQTRSRS